jgi:hypothetical protein
MTAQIARYLFPAYMRANRKRASRDVTLRRALPETNRSQVGRGLKFGATVGSLIRLTRKPHLGQTASLGGHRCSVFTDLSPFVLHQSFCLLSLAVAGKARLLVQVAPRATRAPEPMRVEAYAIPQLPRAPWRLETMGVQALRERKHAAERQR